jgi:hypothetical protein
MQVLATAPGAHHYRLQFLEFMPTGLGENQIISLGDGSWQQNTLSSVPYELIVDRVYIHGDPSYGQRRGISLNSASTTIMNSYISDIKDPGLSDSQAIAGWNGPGPYTITNNFLEAAGENVMFGGADPKIPNLIPSDIKITRNHLFKPLHWRNEKWTVKNLLELKNAQRVTVDGNLFENNWQAAQQGWAIVLQSTNQEGTAPWSVVRDVQFTNNYLRNVAGGISLVRQETPPSVESSNILIRNNLFQITRAMGGHGWFMVVIGGSDFTVDHNTIINDGTSALFADVRPSQTFVFTSNVLVDNGYAIMGSGASPGNGSISKYFPGGRFFGGLFIKSNPANYPTGNFYPPSIDAAGFVNYWGGDYRLSSSSIYRNGGADGKDPGCDFAALNAAMGR